MGLRSAPALALVMVAAALVVPANADRVRGAKSSEARSGALETELVNEGQSSGVGSGKNMYVFSDGPLAGEPNQNHGPYFFPKGKAPSRQMDALSASYAALPPLMNAPQQAGEAVMPTPNRQLRERYSFGINADPEPLDTLAN